MSLLAIEDLTRPTPSRGRSLRNLTVNTFTPIGLLPSAWKTGEFDWDPDLDEILEARLGSHEAVVQFAEERLLDLRDFLLTMESEMGETDLTVTSSRGAVTYTELMASQRWHAAFHYRQLRAFVKQENLPAPALPYSLDGLSDLDLPAEVF